MRKPAIAQSDRAAVRLSQCSARAAATSSVFSRMETTSSESPLPSLLFTAAAICLHFHSPVLRAFVSLPVQVAAFAIVRPP